MDIYSQIVDLILEHDDPNECADAIIQMLQAEGILNSDEEDEEFNDDDMSNVRFV